MAETRIHPTAIIEPGAELDSSVVVGPYTVIGGEVKIGAGTEISSHCVINGNTSIGRNNSIGPFVTVGAPPQDIRYKGEDTKLYIGDNNLIREYCSLHRGTPDSRGITSLEDGNMLMAYCHIAHDCKLGSHIIMANAATLGGHVEVEDRATFGGMVAVHQFTRIGCYSYIGGMSGISKDVPPYLIVSGIRSKMRVTGINKIGLKRAGMTTKTIKKIDSAFRIIFRTQELLLQDALDQVHEEYNDCEEVVHLVNFFRQTQRSVIRTSIENE